MTIKRFIKYGDVNIGQQPHLLISYSDKPDVEWRHIALLSLAPTIQELKLELLVHQIEFMPILEMMNSSLRFFLFELKNDNNISYLCHYSSGIGNVYSKIHYTYISNISKNNILYYLNTKSKQLCIWNHSSVNKIEQHYVDILVDSLFNEGIGKAKQEYASIYNDNLNKLFSLVFKDLPEMDNFQIAEKPTLIEFAQFLSTLNINQFCNIINLLLKVKFVSKKQVADMLIFYHVNSKHQQHSKTCH